MNKNQNLDFNVDEILNKLLLAKTYFKYFKNLVINHISK